MKIHPPRITHENDQVVISALVESQRLGRQNLWYSLDRHFSALICNSSDAFLAALLIVAMADGEDVFLEGPVSARLFYGLSHRYQHILRCEIPWLKGIKVVASALESRPPAGAGVATGFSAGVDSFCVLADHFYAPVPEGFKVSHLLFSNVGSHGPSEAGERLFEARYSHARNVARKLGLPMIKVNSNLDSFYADYGARLDFEQTHTPRSASVALLLQTGIRRYMYASAYSYPDIRVSPTRSVATSDPISLPLLATDALDVLSVGSEYTRFEKTLRVAELADSHDSLNVCVNSPDGRNCSQCWKCMRTLLTLEIAGLAQRYIKSFDMAIYHRHRDRYISTILCNPDPLLREVREFAKQRGFRFPLISRVIAGGRSLWPPRHPKMVD